MLNETVLDFSNPHAVTACGELVCAYRPLRDSDGRVVGRAHGDADRPTPLLPPSWRR